EERTRRRADERARARRGRRAAVDQRRARRARQEPDREEGLREAAADRQEARRGRGSAPRPPDREVHQRRRLGLRAVARRTVGRGALAQLARARVDRGGRIMSWRAVDIGLVPVAVSVAIAAGAAGCYGTPRTTRRDAGAGGGVGGIGGTAGNV